MIPSPGVPETADDPDQCRPPGESDVIPRLEAAPAGGRQVDSAAAPAAAIPGRPGLEGP